MKTLLRGLLVLAVLCTAPSFLEAQVRGGVYGTSSYTVRPGDVLQIRVWPDTALSGEFPIEETGFAYLPVIGRIQAGGRIIEDLRAELRTEYAREMTMPVVTVTPIFRVSVLGAVRAPGLFRVDPTMNLFDVVSMAGGFMETADPNRLRILRQGQVFEIAAASALRTGEPIGGVGLQSGDRIVVPEQRWKFLTWNNVVRAAELAISVFTLVSVIE